MYLTTELTTVLATQIRASSRAVRFRWERREPVGNMVWWLGYDES
ncbi:hypothetical protein FKM95_000251 [Candidatus Tremblaya phenacola]|nr:hypothetical protein FKM95_000251 [Candidatus Tremblaya phenacola]